MIYLGLIVFFVSLLYIIFSFGNIMINGVKTPGYFSTIAAILLLGGIQLISIGIVGEYIGRIYYEVKQRPKYIVQVSNLKPVDKTKGLDSELEMSEYPEEAEEQNKNSINREEHFYVPSHKVKTEKNKTLVKHR